MAENHSDERESWQPRSDRDAAQGSGDASGEGVGTRWVSQPDLAPDAERHPDAPAHETAQDTQDAHQAAPSEAADVHDTHRTPDVVEAHEVRADSHDAPGFRDEAPTYREEAPTYREEAATYRDQAPVASVVAAGANSPEHDRLVAERAARKQARLAALAPAPTPDPAAATPARRPGESVVTGTPVVSEPVTVVRRSTDRFAGSLGLFLLRLIVAAVFGVHGMNKLLNLPGTIAMLERTVIPAPSIMAIVIGAAEVAVAIALVFGLLTRVAGLGAVLIAGGALAFVLWGPWSPFQPGQSGFTGELELLLVGAGLLFLLVGGGGWSVDHGFRARRADTTA